ncbi:TetR/AcrR family transcriptional regulator [Amycolatopsis acidiphila]|uniref:TetR/AcrR family transcriptional regulator n=1 Tax=Amycolatopsis acidiphila TaxID=715473 RepID=A0A558AEJ1_9PSEU|nr:TetR/AcrR family transcriptional regulator [Amycolatopsis acidiphila]TVT22678.1 TetR/AcrR family transcriptional regulator [Amycolatopsis acidiphila]UIJ59558.1 TetR/AcrR family transcriptional regulator [Amycolatopsis acidiphila]GHG80610.1 putative TetR-family transcriptional regulator [Amycolatopsis acidiphila]
MAGVKRRTQAERRMATRTALLEATVECLVEFGYANVTAAQIAARAGVTRGAQAHYFATKAELVVAGLEYAIGRIVEQLRADPPHRPTEAETVLAVVDRLWAMHDSKMFTAVTELWLGSRTDAELRKHVYRLNRQLNGGIGEILNEAVPDFLARPRGTAVILTALAGIRGVLLMSFVSSARTTKVMWTITRREIEASVADAIGRS